MEQRASSITKEQEITEAQKRDQVALKNFGIPYKMCCSLQKEEVKILIEQEEDQ